MTFCVIVSETLGYEVVRCPIARRNQTSRGRDCWIDESTVEYTYLSRTLGEKGEDIRKWFRQHNITKVMVSISSTSNQVWKYNFYFRKENDAVLFKLVWG